MQLLYSASQAGASDDGLDGEDSELAGLSLMEKWKAKLTLSLAFSGGKIQRQVRLATKAMEKMPQADALVMRNHLKLVWPEHVCATPIGGTATPRLHPPMAPRWPQDGTKEKRVVCISGSINRLTRPRKRMSQRTHSLKPRRVRRAVRGTFNRF